MFIEITLSGTSAIETRRSIINTDYIAQVRKAGEKVQITMHMQTSTLFIEESYEQIKNMLMSTGEQRKGYAGENQTY